MKLSELIEQLQEIHLEHGDPNIHVDISGEVLIISKIYKIKTSEVITITEPIKFIALQ
jgi:hypothetical protein